MKSLDMFCCAGGASRGMADAGLEVHGVDCEDQPEYPYPSRFTRGDALGQELAYLRWFDLIWASPPCQHFTAYKRRPGHVAPCENRIPETRELLKASGVPYIIENVATARAHLVNPVMLCGSMFGLDVQRHRLFECSFPVPQPACDHGRWTPRFPPATNRKNKRKTVEVGVWRIPLETQRAAMGIDWMSVEKLSQAIPPAYAEYLARHAIAHIEAKRAA